MISVDRLAKTLAAIFAVGLAGPVAAHAATLTVNTTVDDASAPSASMTSCPATCTLRDAMIVAGNTSGASTIDVPAGHYRLTLAPSGTDDGTTGDLQFSGGTLTIAGASARNTIIDATGLGDRVFDLPGSGSLTLEHLTITGGSVADNGGGIRDDGTANVTLTDLALVGNTASQTGSGGGLYVGFGSTVSIDHSLIAENQNSGDGGAIDTSGMLTITDSTLADNTVDTSLFPSSSTWGAFGGAIEVDDGTVGLTNVTIAGNTIHGTNNGPIASSSGGSGTAISGSGAGVTGVNVIVYGNTASGTAIAGDCNDGPLTSDGHNVDQDATCFGAGSGDGTADPKLGVLGDNGGETDTMAISSSGSAYDAGLNAACPATDQRGVNRPVAANCDIGAFELDPPVNTAAPTITGTAQPGDTLSCSQGGWTGSPFQSYAYQWKLGGSAISGATSTGYQVRLTDVGQQLTCTVTSSTRGDGSASATSAAVTVTVTPATTTPQPRPAVVSGLRVSPRKLSIAGRKMHQKCVKPTKKNRANQHCQRPSTLKVGYTLNAASTVTFTLKLKRTGRKEGGRCVRPTKKNRHKPKCAALVSIHGTLVKTGKTGANGFIWNGKIGGHKLAPGTYDLTAIPAGGVSETVAFTIVG